MSYKSTIEITRDKALEIIRQELFRYEKDDLTDEEVQALADIAGTVVDKNTSSPYHFNNFDIKG